MHMSTASLNCVASFTSLFILEEETRSAHVTYATYWAKMPKLLKVTKFCNNDFDQTSVSFKHMFNAHLNCVASFKSSHQTLLEEMRRQYYIV